MVLVILQMTEVGPPTPSRLVAGLALDAYLSDSQARSLLIGAQLLLKLQARRKPC